MNIIRRFFERARDALTPKRGQPTPKALPETTFAAPDALRGVPTLSVAAHYAVKRPESAGVPEITNYGGSGGAGSGVSAGYAPPVLDAATLNEALCTQCRRYANDIAAQEVL